MKLNYISNDNKNLERKMRFFADYFSFTNEFIGKLPSVPFDNQLSLIDKTIFEIESNFDHCDLYIIIYLSELFLNHTTYGSNNATFLEIKQQFFELKKSNDKKRWLNTNSDFIAGLRKLHSEYMADLFDNNFNSLLTYIKCKHELKKHKKHIEYSTRILVSMFRFKGHSKNSLDNYINRIISNDEYRFPFPPSILKIEKKEDYKTTVKDFMENRNFDKQFEGLRNLYITELHKSGYFFYVIENCFIEENIKRNFKVTFDQVTFISTSNPDLRKLKKSIKMLDKVDGSKIFSIFFGKNKLLAYINLSYESKESKKDCGLKIVAKELVNMNQYFDGNLSVNNLHYLVYDSFESDQWHATVSWDKVKKTRINKLDYEEIQNNVYETLRSTNSTSKDIILQCENVFLKAFAQDEIEYYWIFIENIFSTIINDGKKIRKWFKKILIKVLNDLKDDFLVKAASLLLPFYGNSTEENLEIEDMALIQAEIFKNHNYQFDIHQYHNKVSSILLKDLLEFHKDFTADKNKHVWALYFDSLLLELYSYKNSLVHSGTVNQYSKIKLTCILPKLIS